MTVELTKEATRSASNVLKMLLESPAGKSLGLGMLSLGIAAPILDDFGDAILDQYTETNKDLWKAKGKMKMLSELGPSLAAMKAQELLYETPVEAAVEGATSSIGDALKGLLGGTPDAGAAFSELRGTPEVSALGKSNAEALFKQLHALAPKTLSSAPSVALPILQTSLDTGSLAIRPEMAANLLKAEQSLSNL